MLCLQMFAKFAREAAGDAGRRRIAARPLAGVLRQRHGQLERPCHRSAADGRASAARVGRGDRHVVLPQKTEIGNLWLSVANHFGAPAGHVRRQHRHGRAVLTCRDCDEAPCRSRRRRCCSAAATCGARQPARRPSPALVRAVQAGDRRRCARWSSSARDGQWRERRRDDGAALGGARRRRRTLGRC